MLPSHPFLPSYLTTVSILTRPGGRVLRRVLSSANRERMFQSSPDPEAGCYDLSEVRVLQEDEFQSSPDPEAGCY